MAKKSKKDKTIAKLRFQLANTQQELARMRAEIGQLKGEKVVEPSIPKKLKKSPTEKKQLTKNQGEIWEYPPELIKKDLLKTLSLSALAILCLLVLYWFKLPD